ncbi:hypothetical protein [Nitrobacter sp.]|uniref:hypothetical protein n=1 Tax=Nitrobacter sp. TaxID=29420 RepID=UPI003F649D8B
MFEFDTQLLHRLPPAAFVKLSSLLDAYERQASITRAAQQESSYLRQQIAKFTARGGDLSPVDQVKNLRSELDTILIKKDRELGHTTQHQELLKGIRDWLAAIPESIQLRDHVAKDAGVSKSSPGAIEKRRRRIRELLADIGRVDAAPISTKAAKQQAREEVKKLAERGRPAVHKLLEDRGGIGWPQRKIGFAGMIDLFETDSLAVMAFALEESLIAAVEREIDEVGGAADSLTDDERFNRFDKLFDKLLAAEREEEALIAAADFDVQRRSDADPRAVLGISSDAPLPNRNLTHQALFTATLSAR